jgi:hypothetical protein
MSGGEKPRTHAPAQRRGGRAGQAAGKLASRACLALPPIDRCDGCWVDEVEEETRWPYRSASCCGCFDLRKARKQSKAGGDRNMRLCSSAVWCRWRGTGTRAPISGLFCCCWFFGLWCRELTTLSSWLLCACVCGRRRYHLCSISTRSLAPPAKGLRRRRALC